MSFELRQLPHITSRIVRMGDRIFKLWSPNSTQLPFFPGFRRADFDVSTPVNPAERRYNGHRGRMDCLHVPQYFRAGAVHWPFLRRPSLVTPSDPSAAAFQPLTIHWRDDPPYSRTGRLDASFTWRLSAIASDLDARMEALRRSFRPGSTTWALRPTFASGRNVRMLDDVRYWDEVVDLGVALQRGLREREAWVAWREEATRLEPLLIHHLREMQMPLADESFVGLWVNGLEESAVLKYMALAVPCFVVHEYRHQERVREGTTYSLFLEGTEIESLLSDDNPYQHVAREAGRLDSIARGDDGHGTAPLYLHSLYLRFGLILPRPPLLDLVDPPNRDSSHSSRSYAALPLEYPEVDPDRVPWIVPPPVAKAKPGKWHRFELDELDGNRAFLYRGKGKQVESRLTFFDRVNRRRLHLGSYQAPEGVVEPKVFGMPVLPFPFYHPGSGIKLIPKRASQWMYKTPEPRPEDVGHSLSNVERLKLLLRKAPNLQESAASDLDASEGAGTGDAKGKGKGKEKAIAVEDDGQSDYGEGMDVDEPREEEIPSSIVVIDGTDSSVSALMFQAMSTDALGSVRLRAIGVTRGRDHIWLRFASTEEAQRAFGAMGSIGQELRRSFASLADFEETSQYSRDLWFPSTTVDAGYGQDTPMPSPEPPQEVQPTSGDASQPPLSRPASAPSVTCMQNSEGERGFASPGRSDCHVRPVDAAPHAHASGSLAEHSHCTVSHAFVNFINKCLLTPHAGRTPHGPVSRIADPSPQARSSLPSRTATEAPLPPPSPRDGGAEIPSGDTSLTSPLPVDASLDAPSPKKARLTSPERAPEDGEILEGEPAEKRKRKAWRGHRSGRIAKENARRRAERAAQITAVVEAAEATGDAALMDWVPVLQAAADAEDKEDAEEEEFVEDVSIPSWAWHDDESGPVAGPSH
ncbi:hypothetical protein DFH07DRAFT_959028 [Mycena maculata]|uniref:Uncharacterized protein n=1 Tax=Mycena maculata TaxID=230809 RepID=A0AAD7NEW2_9AGAR|nr:hypothetical protein DFH07DRAFT_959028 [Mycena maculata]